jgi:hypothetical protein
MTENGDKFVTYKDLMAFQDRLFSAIEKRDLKVSEVVEDKLSDIVGRMNIYAETQTACRKDIEPIIQRHKSFNKLFWMLISTLCTNVGTVIAAIVYIIRYGG